MATTRSVLPESQEKPLQNYTLSKPLLMCLILFLIALLFKWIDTFILRMDERLGELIISKILGFLMVLVWLWLTGRKLADIGLHTDRLRLHITTGVLTTIAAFIVGYGVEILAVSLQGQKAGLTLGAVDSKMGVTGGLLFALWLVLGNFINSFMEEGLFRGVMGRLARIRLGFWQSIFFQAIIFSIWHLPWVLKYYQLGQISSGGEIAMSIFFNSVPQFLIGIVYGYFYLKTGSLWAPWIAHVLNNSIANILHVTTSDSVDSLFPLRMSVYIIIMGLSMLWVKRVASKNHLTEATSWA